MLPLRLAAEDGPLRVLCLGAHADDLEIGCGGTLMRLSGEQSRMEVRWMVFSSPDERKQEAAAGAKLFLAQCADVETSLLNFRDGFFPAQFAEIKEAFERLKADFRPSLVLTHFRGDMHQDHRLVSELTWNTFRDHLIWEYEIPKYDGDLGNPNLFVPLSEEVVRRKVEGLIETFRTQRSRSWFAPETFRGLMRLRGVACNAFSGFAEAFYCPKAVV
jgi:LmbE family N-acetylglucosaminyl deacetylase